MKIQLSLEEAGALVVRGLRCRHAGAFDGDLTLRWGHDAADRPMLEVETLGPAPSVDVAQPHAHGTN